MAYSIKTYAGTGAAGAFTTPEYLDSSHIEVYVDDVLKTVTTHYTITGTTVSFTAGNFPTSSNTIKIIRKSSQSTRLVDYTDGAVEVAATFDEDSKQSLFMAQEALDGAEAIGTVVFQPLEVAPSTPLEGTVYYDASSNNLQFWNGSSFITVTDDATVVKLTGNQTVAGAKSFTSNVDVTGTVEAIFFTGIGSVAITDFIDDDTFATATATNVPTAESVKAYVNASGGNETLAQTLVLGNSTGGTNLQVSASDDLLLSDTSKLKFETDGSNYLQIYKSAGASGTSYIHEVGGGALVIKGESGYLRNDNDESQVTWNADGVTLGYNGVGVLDTTATGINVTGKVECKDTVAITTTGSGGDPAPDLDFINLHADAIGERLGQINYYGMNDESGSGSGQTKYAWTEVRTIDVTEDSEKAQHETWVKNGASHTRVLAVEPTGINVTGTVTPSGGYNSSDGTAGYTGSASASATLTIKNGLIVAVS